MALDFTDSLDVLMKAEQMQLSNKLILQLKKDFARANVQIEISIKDGFQLIRDSVREKVYFLLMERFDSYLNLLYAIDVSEHLFKNIQVTDAVEVSEQVSFLILKREFQKVWFKEKYS
ncbi:hypothetical protein [Maribacter sp. 2210JD10-5]|uniref:hypothetical protein n=1 Tax=Maribacter sp. 2210JD10-5 TaxID=3386272 RepID=UPI0039BD3060